MGLYVLHVLELVYNIHYVCSHAHMLKMNAFRYEV